MTEAALDDLKLRGASHFLNAVAPPPLTPVRLSKDSVTVWCKLEFLNPSGSTKDRIARHILEKAWNRGEISAGDTVVEASSGSTSIAFALACAQMQLKFVAYIPDCATNERELIIRAYGGEVKRVSGGMSNVLRQAYDDAQKHGWFAGRQFSNPDNTEAHRECTGPEILAQLPGGRVDAVVSGVGTGGTLRGLHGSFAAGGDSVRAFAAIPREGEVFNSNVECCSLRFSSDVPGVADGISEIYSDWKADVSELEIGDCECLAVTKKLWSLGFPVGPSSGLNFAAAMQAAEKIGRDKTIVTVFPDRMERYFSHKVFEQIRDAQCC